VTTQRFILRVDNTLLWRHSAILNLLRSQYVDDSQAGERRQAPTHLLQLDRKLNGCEVSQRELKGGHGLGVIHKSRG